MTALTTGVMKTSSIPDHEFNSEATGSQRQVVCSCGWRSKVWGRDNEYRIDAQWLSHIATKIPHRVVVSREATPDDAGVNVTWILLKLKGDDWVPCRHDNPADEAAFETALETNWMTLTSGRYELQVRELVL